MSGHECEEWMLDDSAKGGKYCRACGKDQAPAEPAEPGVFQLGQRVRFTHALHRFTRKGENYRTRKVWEPHPDEEVATTPREGVIVGKRQLANGRRYWESYDEGGSYEFVPEERFTAYLVSFAMHRKPVHVLPEHITPELVEALTEEDKHFRDTGCDSSLHPEDCLSAVQGVLA